MRVRITTTLDPEIDNFLRYLSAQTREDLGKLLDLSVKLMQYYIITGSDEILVAINEREPEYVTRLQKIRQKALEQGSPIPALFKARG